MLSMLDRMDAADRPSRTRWGVFLQGQLELAAALGVLMTIIWAFSGHGYYWPRWVWLAFAIPIGLQAGIRRAIQISTGGRRGFLVHAAVFAVVAPLEVVIWLFAGRGVFWPIWPILGLSVGLGAHAWAVGRPRPQHQRVLEERVDVLTRSRSGALDVQAAELQRIERDLHDGAQARMVSLGMSLGLAEELLQRDPDAVAELLAEARMSTLAALDEMRTVMRGIQPPVLADRGLAGAVEALALDVAVAVTVRSDLSGRAPAPVESAVYYAVAECLANVVKHSDATHAWVVMVHRHGILAVVVGDDGMGGANFELGTGLRGVARRLEAFDGTLELESPPAGPTSVTMEVPCELSSPKTSPSSGTA